MGNIVCRQTYHHRKDLPNPTFVGKKCLASVKDSRSRPSMMWLLRSAALHLLFLENTKTSGSNPILKSELSEKHQFMTKNCIN